jgi:hypothetical protein
VHHEVRLRRPHPVPDGGVELCGPGHPVVRR